MPTLKTLNGKDKYFNPDARELVARYIFNPWKSPNGYCGGIDTGNGDNMAASIVAQMDIFTKTTGYSRDILWSRIRPMRQMNQWW